MFLFNYQSHTHTHTQANSKRLSGDQLWLSDRAIFKPLYKNIKNRNSVYH